jgi:hypothetical protein
MNSTRSDKDNTISKGMKSEKQILPFIQQKVNEYAWTPWGKVVVKSAKFTDEAGQLGITYLLAKYLENK